MMIFMWFLLFTLICLIGAAQGLKCFKCDSSVDKNCIDDLKKFKPEECEEGESSCTVRLDSKGEIVRGCSDPDSFCPSTMCEECEGDGCNTNIACYKCNSSTNANCAQVTSVRFAPELCSGKDDKCMTFVKDDKNIERKCSANECDANKTKTCETCEKAYCNKDIFPKDRRLCYQCSKSNGDCNDLKTLKAIPCRLYDENEKCYTIGTSATDMNRGCVSDSENKCSGETCVTCTDQSCNNQAYSRDPSRKCFQCGPAEICSKEANVCKKPVQYWKDQELCFIQTSGGNISRGCVNDRESGDKPCDSDNLCKTCNKDACNTGFGLNSTFISFFVTIFVFVFST